MAVMRFEKAEDGRPPRISFIPLIDIVLQIICFYLFVSAGVQSYQDASVELPVMRAEQLTSERPSEFTINLGADGTMNVNGAPLDVAALPAALEAAKTKAVELNQHLMVAIRADRRQQFALLDNVLQACREADVPAVSLRSMAPTAGGAGGAMSGGGGGIER
ncbi:MAG TPA: biopolymer transporter ExbD [Tepidisphaeraceae bacterium]|nr:biopolymer transporter ExbD [Tepidisphaeraceae bacterium]